MLNKISIIDVFIGIFPKNIHKNCIKRKPSGSSILNASNEGTLKKKLVEVNSPQSWPWKQNGTKLWLLWWFSKLWPTEEWCYREIYRKKIGLWTLISFPFRKCSYNCNTWVTGVYMAYMFEWNSGGKTSQIEWLLESNLRSFGYFKCSTAL